MREAVDIAMDAKNAPYCQVYSTMTQRKFNESFGQFFEGLPLE